MTTQPRWLVALLLVATLLITACGGGSAPAAATTTPAEAAEAAEPEATATTAATATVAPTETAEPTEMPEPTETAEPTDDAEPVTARRLEDIEDINSFRLEIFIAAEGDAFADDENMAMMAGGVNVTGEFVKEPPAQHLALSIPAIGDVEFILLGDQGYTMFGGTWIETPAEDAPSVADFTFISPEDFGEDMDQLEEVGTETVNGRETRHLRGDQETLAGMADTAEAGIGIQNAEEAQVDLWIDEEEGFIVKMEVVAEGTGLNEELPDAEGRVEMRVEYSDFNEEFEIEAPDVEDTTSLELPEQPADLADLLGVQFVVPEGTEASVFGSFGELSTDFTLEEATDFVMEQLDATTLVLNEEESSMEAGVLYYDLEDGGRIAVFLTEAEDGGTTILFEVQEAAE